MLSELAMICEGLDDGFFDGLVQEWVVELRKKA
jgi:hypothetical protein